MSHGRGKKLPIGKLKALRFRTPFRSFERLEARTMFSVSGDFNGDGFADLAIGLPGRDSPTDPDTGAVHVIYGTNRGLDTPHNKIWSRGSTGVLGDPKANEQFGASLAVGDFNGDGYDDIAIGVINDNVGGVSNAGSVQIIYGNEIGLKSKGNQIWNQNSPGIDGVARIDEHFGTTLTAGDFDGDGYDDLAIGTPDDFVGDVRAGSVNILYGRSSGLNAARDQQWTQNSTSINGIAQAGDKFGSSLAAGDFNGDGHDDLAIGVIGEAAGSLLGAGAVNVIYSNSKGLRAASDQLFQQGQNGVGETAEAGDAFGMRLAAGRTSRDPFDNLIIGTPLEERNGVAGVGVVQVLLGSEKRLTTSSLNLITPDNFNIELQPDMHFGDSLAVGDFDNNDFDDIAIGIPNFNNGAALQSGAVHIVYNSFIFAPNPIETFWTQNTRTVPDVAETGDHFGAALAVGDFDGNGQFDLAIGVPDESETPDVTAGAVNVLYGFHTGLIDIGSQIWSENTYGMAGAGRNGDRFGGIIA